MLNPRSGHPPLSLIRRADAACYSVLVTVDIPMLGWREADLANADSPKGSGSVISSPIRFSVPCWASPLPW